MGESHLFEIQGSYPAVHPTIAGNPNSGKQYRINVRAFVVAPGVHTAIRVFEEHCQEQPRYKHFGNGQGEPVIHQVIRRTGGGVVLL